jgi:hypothetical protein
MVNTLISTIYWIILGSGIFYVGQLSKLISIYFILSIIFLCIAKTNLLDSIVPFIPILLLLFWGGLITCLNAVTLLAPKTKALCLGLFIILMLHHQMNILEHVMTSASLELNP